MYKAIGTYDGFDDVIGVFDTEKEARAAAEWFRLSAKFFCVKIGTDKDERK